MRCLVALICAVFTSAVVDAADVDLRDWVFLKEGVKAKVDDREIDPEPMFVPGIVHAIDNDRLWVAQGWVNRSDVMSLDEAKKFFDDQIVSMPENAQGWRRRGLVHSVKKDYAAAHRDLIEAVRLDPANAIFLCDRADVRVDRGEFMLALADCNDALRLDPKCVLAYCIRGVNWARQSEYDKAIDDLSEAIRLNSTIGYLFQWRSLVWSWKGLQDLAISDLNRAIECDPKDASNYSARGTCWYWKRQYRDAISDFERAISLAPNFTDGYQGVAWILSTCPFNEFRDGTRAVVHAKKACELSMWLDPFCIQSLAAAYAEAGDWDEAIVMAKRYIALAIKNPSLRDGKYELELYEKGIPYHEALTVWETLQFHFWKVMAVALLTVWLCVVGWIIVRRRRAMRLVRRLDQAGRATLEAINVDGERLGPFLLDQLRIMPRLKNLSLVDTDLTDDGLKDLEGLSSLLVLNLARTRIGDDGLQHLRGLPNLRRIDLSDTLVTGQGLRHLSDLAGLQDLTLSRTHVCDAGLIELNRCRGLRQLDLTGTEITDAGLEHLQGLTSLMELWLGDTKTTPVGRAQLRQALPECRVEPRP